MKKVCILDGHANSEIGYLSEYSVVSSSVADLST